MRSSIGEPIRNNLLSFDMVVKLREASKPEVVETVRTFVGEPAPEAHQLRPKVAAPPAPVHEGDALAHDVSTVLAILERMSGQLGEPGVLTEGHQAYAANLQGVAKAASALMVQMLEVHRKARILEPKPAKTKRGSSATRSDSFGAGRDASLMVAECEGVLRATAGAKSNLRVSRERLAGSIGLSQEELTRVLVNLVQNSAEAMPQGGDITVEVRRGLRNVYGPTVLLTVRDTGCGIPPYAVKQVFRAGFSSKGLGKSPSGQAGLGLAIVRELVEGAGGTVEAQSTVGRGTTIMVKLPCL